MSTVSNLEASVIAKKSEASPEMNSMSAPELPISAEGMPISTQEPPISAQGQPISAQGLPISAQGIPISAQGLTISAQGIPISGQGLYNFGGLKANFYNAPLPAFSNIPPLETIPSLPPVEAGVLPIGAQLSSLNDPILKSVGLPLLKK